MISRQAAIEAIEKARANVGHNMERAVGAAFIEILDDVGEDIGRLPSAQFATDTNVGTKLGTNLAQLGTDCISRQAAIDAIDDIESEVADGFGFQYEKWRKHFAELPSAQPKIIRCKDCRYYNSEEKECLDLLGHGRRWEEDDYCSYAENGEETE